MSDEETNIGRRRSRGSQSSARTQALQRLKAIRSGGRKAVDDDGAIQFKVEDPIYDTFDEDEYEALVAKRREEGKDFIVDDEGLGYGDEGQEEDWTTADGPLYSDESDGEAERPKRKRIAKRNDGNPEKKEPQMTKKPTALSAAATLMGKTRISSLFTSSVFKKNRDDNMVRNSDSIVDDVLAEFAPDESDRERRRRRRVAPNLVSNRTVFVPMNSNAVPINVQMNTVSEGVVPGVRLKDSESNNLNSQSVVAGKEINDVVKESGSENTSTDVLKDEMDGAVIPFSEERQGDGENMADEVQLEVGAKLGEKVFSLNAKIKGERDSALSATAGWQALQKSDNVAKPCDISVVVQNLSNEEKSDYEVDPDGSLPFYILDAYEEMYGNNAGNIYLFGKVKSGDAYHSCCVVVKNMQRCVYAFPSASVFDDDKIMKLQRDVEESKISSTEFRAQLHEMASGLKTEITNELLEHNVSSFSMAPVKRNYAFDRTDIPKGENYVLKITYPFKDPPLPSDSRGENYFALLGTHSSALENFLIKRKIVGPSWLSISRFSSIPAPQRVSWCKFEVSVDSPKDIQVTTSSKHAAEIPPVVVTAINLKTIINDKQNQNEIISASVICCKKVKIDRPMLASEWTKQISHFTVVRKIDGIFPMGFSKEAAERNTKAGYNLICSESSERALLSRLMVELHKLDSDVLVGHNISGFDLDVLLHRFQAYKVPSSVWSKIGRLKRSTMPKLSKGNSFGLGASPGIMSCIAGRLLCDTYLCSRDLLKEVSYSLTQLTKTQLNKDRTEITPQDIPQMFQSSERLMELIQFGETDAWLSMELMFHLSVLPLTRQLTNISGNLWGKTLQGARAQRVEYLLLHAFHAKKFVVPDRLTSQAKEIKMIKRKVNHAPDSKEIDSLYNQEANLENESLDNNNGKAKKGPSYAGGLVLEPKKGLYDKYILLLDFNSLYPSIIQEYNICFTTVERLSDGLAPRLPSNTEPGLLPELLKHLVERRKTVKNGLKAATGLKAQQLDIQQQALKLTANSMYGCLGFSNSRFYAKPLAELITLQGREILQSTVDLVQNTLNLEVIYGDTDSIMIYSGLDDMGKAKAIAGKVIREVNKKYKRLEIDLDGLYKRMLLLKKKKYAAIKVQFKDGKPYEVIERKGLDMVRRDWSLLSKEMGDFCLSQILSGGSCDDVVESIHNSLVKVQEEMRNGQIELEKYIITKTLTKAPEAYPDAKSQPHVEVALRLKKKGYVTGCSAGDTVPYIICCDQENGSSSSGIAQRARHPDEVTKGNEKWIIDIDYYLAHQIHPVVSRLCAPIQGTSPAHLADCLGLDSSKFQSKTTEAVNGDSSTLLSCAIDDEERYRGCEPLFLSCPSCSKTFGCLPIFGSISSSSNQKPADSQNFWLKLRCPTCPEEGDRGTISSALIANQVKKQAEGYISTYYQCWMMCDDETCKYTTRCLNLRVLGDSELGTLCPNYPRCTGRLLRKYSEADLYKQLAYFCHILDTTRCVDKLEVVEKQVEKELARLQPVVQLASSIVCKLRDRCAYGWVQMDALSVSI